jgi:hypothetical protein
MTRFFLLLFASGCATGREPLSFDLSFDAQSGCDTVQLHVPMERLWLQQPPDLVVGSWSPFASAWAHPGHDPAGDVTGEVIGPWDLDPCGPAAELGVGLGYDSEVASGELILRGRATLVGALDGLPVDLDLDLDHPVTGIPLFADLHDGDRVRLAVDLDFVLSFLSVDDTDGDGVLTIADDGVAASFTYALTNPNAWSLQLESR